ncbi:alpha/beta fold hydrolase [Acidomonas methanolica]|uniref:alpha/beta fold hydrolase n=1 Tax=Acidomonas methanolica TaxID=437 RepID=UPI00211A013C|nr:biotin synthase [Acidomonas methanolica]MCQ9156031.1 biotin synthase [Acidomonas methanolica]
MRRVFVHGWSYDAGLWDGVCGALGEADSWRIELGQTGAPVRDALPLEPYLAVTHSAGTLWLLEQDLRHCAGIVAVNGFARFTAGADFPDGVPPRVVQRMRRRLETEAAEVVATFRREIGGAPPAAPLCGARLDDGLQRLLASDGRAAAHSMGARLIWLAGMEDRLVTPAMARAGFGPLARENRCAGGHLLPLDAPETVAALLREAEGHIGR